MRNRIIRITGICVALVMVLTLSFSFIATPQVAAQPVQKHGGTIVENFDRPLQYRLPGVPSRYDWWIIDDENGVQNYGHPCDPKGISCVTWMHEHGDSFARLTINPDPNPPAVLGYNNVELSELQTEFSYNLGKERWCPSPHHEIVWTERMRFGANYGEDGSGGATGSSGNWLWNSYPQEVNGNVVLNPVTAVGFAWGEQGTAFGLLDGLAVEVLKDNQPLYFNKVRAPQTPLVMSDWMTWTTTWYRLPSGQDRVTFEVSQYGHTYQVGDSGPVDSVGCLSLTHWNDIQFVTGFNLDGSFQVEMHNPTSPDNWDLTYLKITQK